MEGNGILSREDLLSGRSFRTNEINIGGKTLLLRELSAVEWMELSKQEKEAAERNKESSDPAGANLDGHFDRVAALICKTAVSSEGARLFSDDDKDAIRAKLGAATLMEVYQVLARLTPGVTVPGGA